MYLYVPHVQQKWKKRQSESRSRSTQEIDSTRCQLCIDPHILNRYGLKSHTWHSPPDPCVANRVLHLLVSIVLLTTASASWAGPGPASPSVRYSRTKANPLRPVSIYENRTCSQQNRVQVTGTGSIPEAVSTPTHLMVGNE